MYLSVCVRERGEEEEGGEWSGLNRGGRGHKCVCMSMHVQNVLCVSMEK